MGLICMFSIPVGSVFCWITGQIVLCWSRVSWGHSSGNRLLYLAEYVIQDGWGGSVWWRWGLETAEDPGLLLMIERAACRCLLWLWRTKREWAKRTFLKWFQLVGQCWVMSDLSGKTKPEKPLPMEQWINSCGNWYAWRLGALKDSEKNMLCF